MSKPSFDARTYMEAVAPALDIALDAAWTPGIVDNLQRSYQIAQAFLTFPLPDDIEPASRFQP